MKQQQKADVFVKTRQRQVICCGNTYRSNGAGVIRFLALLWWRKRFNPTSPWVTAAEVADATHSSGAPRQMARFVDFIHALPLPVLALETKTSGRWRLSCKVERIAFDVEESELAEWLGLPTVAANRASKAATPVSTVAGVDLFNLVSGLVRADSKFFDGNINRGKQSAQRLLNELTVPDDPYWQIPVNLRRMYIDLRLGNSAGVKQHASEVRRALSFYEDTEAVNSHLQVFLAKERYGQGDNAAAKSLLMGVSAETVQDRFTLSRYYSVKGMLLGREWRHRIKRPRVAFREATARQSLLSIEYLFAQSMHYALQVADYHGLQATAFNLSHCYLAPVFAEKVNANDTYWLPHGLSWLGLCQYLNSHFFAGEDSNAMLLTILELTLLVKKPFHDINQWTGQPFGNINSLERALQYALEMANVVGNAKEITAVEALVSRYKESGIKDL